MHLYTMQRLGKHIWAGWTVLYMDAEFYSIFVYFNLKKIQKNDCINGIKPI